MNRRKNRGGKDGSFTIPSQTLLSCHVAKKADSCSAPASLSNSPENVPSAPSTLHVGVEPNLQLTPMYTLTVDFL